MPDFYCNSSNSYLMPQKWLIINGFVFLTSQKKDFSHIVRVFPLVSSVNSRCAPGPDRPSLSLSLTAGIWMWMPTFLHHCQKPNSPFQLFTFHEQSKRARDGLFLTGLFLSECWAETDQLIFSGHSVWCGAALMSLMEINVKIHRMQNELNL